MELAVGWFVASCLSHPPINQPYWSFALCLAQTNRKSSDVVLKLLSCQKRPPLLIYSCFIKKLRKIIPNPWNQAFPKSCPLSMFKCEKICLCLGLKKMVWFIHVLAWFWRGAHIRWKPYILVGSSGHRRVSAGASAQAPRSQNWSWWRGQGAAPTYFASYFPAGLPPPLILEPASGEWLTGRWVGRTSMCNCDQGCDCACDSLCLTHVVVVARVTVLWGSSTIKVDFKRWLPTIKHNHQTLL